MPIIRSMVRSTHPQFLKRGKETYDLHWQPPPSETRRCRSWSFQFQKLQTHIQSCHFYRPCCVYRKSVMRHEPYALSIEIVQRKALVNSVSCAQGLQTAYVTISCYRHYPDTCGHQKRATLPFLL